MLPLFLLPILFACSTAQTYTQCECGLFNSAQFNTSVTASPIPLDYTGNSDVVDAANCARDPTLANDCMTYCQTFYDDEDTLDLCEISSNNDRCVGSQWCEALYNNGVKDISDADVSLYYRMTECEGTAFVNWNYGWREIKDQGLCCSGGEFSHCTLPCTTCVERNLCECGIFADIQFDKDRLQGANPLPLQDAGAEFGSGSDLYCNNWPSPEFGHPCDAACVTAAEFYKTNVSLNAISNRNPGVTYGQFYCQALKTRWADNWPEFGIGPTSLVAHARMPGCNVDETNNHLRWKTGRTYACHHEQLCCDGDGNRFACPIPSPVDHY